jgi:hypothetical protein
LQLIRAVIDDCRMLGLLHCIVAVQLVIPVVSPLTVQDVDVSPAARDALSDARECALEYGEGRRGAT